MSKKVYLIIVILAIIALIALFLVDIFVFHNSPKENLLRFSLVLGGLILSLFKISTGGNKNLTVYENAYKEHLNGVFSDNKALRKQLLLAVSDYDTDKIKSSVNRLTKLLKKAENTKDRQCLYLFLALCMTDASAEQLAIEWYSALLEENPYHTTALSNLSVIYRKCGRSDLAIKYAKKAISAQGENVFAYHNLASAYFYGYDIENAEKYALKALELKDNFRESASLLAILYNIKNDIESAKKYTHIALSLGEDTEVLEAVADDYRTGYFNSLEINSKLQKWKDITKKPAIFFTLNGSDGKSIIGGKINENPPIGSNGKPMRLLAAIFCSELPQNSFLPSIGVLRFYITPNDLLGADFDNLTQQKDFRVLFDENESLFETYDCSNNDEYFPVGSSLRPKFTLGEDSMTFDDYRFDKTFENAVNNYGDKFSFEDYENDEFMSELTREEHKLGGYPCFIQCDPREGETSLQRYDTLLFQLASEYSRSQEKIMFGDAGVCNFFISSADLRAKKFSDILYYWDCG